METARRRHWPGACRAKCPPRAGAPGCMWTPCPAADPPRRPRPPPTITSLACHARRGRGDIVTMVNGQSAVGGLPCPPRPPSSRFPGAFLARSGAARAMAPRQGAVAGNVRGASCLYHGEKHCSDRLIDRVMVPELHAIWRVLLLFRPSKVLDRLIWGCGDRVVKDYGSTINEQCAIIMDEGIYTLSHACTKQRWGGILKLKHTC